MNKILFKFTPRVISFIAIILFVIGSLITYKNSTSQVDFMKKMYQEQYKFVISILDEYESANVKNKLKNHNAYMDTIIVAIKNSPSYNNRLNLSLLKKITKSIMKNEGMIATSILNKKGKIVFSYYKKNNNIVYARYLPKYIVSKIKKNKHIKIIKKNINSNLSRKNKGFIITYFNANFSSLSASSKVQPDTFSLFLEEINVEQEKFWIYNSIYFVICALIIAFILIYIIYIFIIYIYRNIISGFYTNIKTKTSAFLSKLQKIKLPRLKLSLKKLTQKEKEMKKFFKDFFISELSHKNNNIFLFDKLNEDECLIVNLKYKGDIKNLINDIYIKLLDKMKTNSISPSAMLFLFNKYIKNNANEGGLSGCVLIIHKKDKTIQYSGANSSLYYGDESHKIKYAPYNESIVGKENNDFKYKGYKFKIVDNMRLYLSNANISKKNEVLSLLNDSQHKKFSKQKETCNVFACIGLVL